MDSIERDQITVAIYSHPEYYPPVLNAIDELAGVFSSVLVVTRNLKPSTWKYPQNVEFTISGSLRDIRASEQASFSWKILSFLRFTKDFYKSLKRKKQEWVMCNDAISLMSFRLIRPFLGYSIRLWYHSHDVVELQSLRKFSVGYFATKSEQGYFSRIELFTLPSGERVEFYPITGGFNGRRLILPNYPSLRRIDLRKYADWEAGADLKLLYQGHIADGHGLEKIIEFIKTDQSLRLTAIGPGDQAFIQSLREKAEELGIKDRVSILDPVPYSELRKITVDHQVGLAIHEPLNIAYRTAALASNKIYEYSASGLPVLYYKGEHYVKYLGSYVWAFPTDMTFQDLAAAIRDIKKNYYSLSRAALADFQYKLNFATVFNPVLSVLTGSSECNK